MQRNADIPTLYISHGCFSSVESHIGTSVGTKYFSYLIAEIDARLIVKLGEYNGGLAQLVSAIVLYTIGCRFKSYALYD